MGYDFNETLSQFCSSKFWDTNLTWNSPDPDFTSCFEKTFLVWIPCAFLWLFSPVEIYSLRATRTFSIGFNLYNTFKLVIIATVGAMSLFDIAYNIYTFSPDTYSEADFYSSIIKVLTFSLVFTFTYFDVIRGIRTSALLFIFSFLLALCGLPQFRSELTKSAHENEIDARSISYLIYYPLTVVLFLLNCFVDARPTIRKYPQIENMCPETEESFLSIIFFSWFDGFMWRGYKSQIKEKDIWNLDYDMDPKEIAKRFETHWYSTFDRFKRRGYKAFDKVPEAASILGPLWRTFGWSFGFGVTFKIVHSLSQFASPAVLKLLIAFVGDEKEFTWHGYVYAIALLIIVFIQTIFLTMHLHIMYRIGIQIRTALVSVIYKKALRISNGARKDFTLGQVVNLMAVDAQRFLEMMPYIPLVAVIPVEIFLCLYFLWGILGPSVLAGLAVLIAVVPLNAAIASRIQKLQIRQMVRKDERVKLMNEIISGIKVLKLNAWEPSFEKEVVRIRSGEIDLLKSTAYLYAGTSFIFTCTPFLVSLVTFAVFVLSSDENVLDAQVAFVSLSLFNILQFPLAMLPNVISTLVRSYVAVKRINKFLNSEELNPHAVSHEPRAERIIIEKGEFSWDSYDGPRILRHIDLKIRPGSLVAVVGPVGAGKSSLLSAFLGEMYKQSGYVNTYGSIAYVPQQAWIRNTTLKDNITFGDRTNDSFYHDVVEACALGPDFKILPGRDQTEIGEKGINLSGGQKQRISLARAVFSNSDIYLLDDPLSAVDSHVGKHIFEEVIEPTGLLKEKTRVLVTHGISYLPQVDNIIVMQDGYISESGTYRELIEIGGVFANFLATYETMANEDAVTGESLFIWLAACSMTIPASSLRSPIYSLLIVLGKDYLTNETATVVVEEDLPQSIHYRRFTNTGGETELNLKEAKLIEVEAMETGNIKWSVITYYLRAAGVFGVMLAITMNISYEVFSVAGNFWLRRWSNDGTTVKNGARDMSKQFMYLGVYGALGLVQAISVVSRTVSMYLAMLKAGTDVHSRLLTSVLHWPVTTFDTIPSGRIINRFGFDIDVLDNVMPNNFSQLLFFMGFVTSTLFMICYSTPTFIYAIIPIGIVYFCAQRFFAATSRQLKRLESVSKSPIYSHFGETVSGAASIRAYELQSVFIETSEKKVAINQKCSYVYYIASRWLAVRLEFLGCLIVFFSSLFIVLSKSTIDTGLAGLSVSYTLQVSELLYLWAQSVTVSETNVVSIERIKEYSEVEPEAPWTLSHEVVPKNWPDIGLITFNDFRVRYRANLEYVLKGISFQVNGGEKVGIVGRTGAGKSSLTLCLFRLLEAAGGSIIIDGIDISKMGLHSLRSRLTIIPQDPVLFPGSLRLNLDPSNTYLDENIWRALELVNLKMFVSNLGLGLQHEVTEGGGNFSVGQRQLICLARALLRKTKILVLDEATAAVDLETDDLIQTIIKEEFKDCTILTIAHRLNTVLDYDRIIVLDKGRVIEFDTPEVLLKSKQSVFYNMAVDAGLLKNGAASV